MVTIEVNIPAGVDAAAVKQMFERTLEDHARTARLGDALAREDAPVGPGVLAQVGRLDRAWRRVRETYGLFTADEVARLTGAPARSARSHVHNLRRRHGLLAVRRGRALAYPGFQFTPGPARVVRPGWRDLTAPLLAAGWSEDEVLLWFASPTGLLSHEAPADLLDGSDEGPEPSLTRLRRAVAQAGAGNPG